jgi:lipid A 3-O-deacylase
MRISVIVVLAAVAAGLASPSKAGEFARGPASEKTKEKASEQATEKASELAKAGDTELGTFTIQFENDLFAGTDRNYTNGVRLSWLSPEGGKTLPILQHARDVLAMIAQDENRKTRFGWALGQEIYTPGDRVPRTLITDDRPYAGWLYGALSLHSVVEGEAGAKTSESVEMSLGIVGPEALGEEAQDFVHSVRLIEKFNGWDNQLETEPGILIAYEKRWRFAKPWNIGNGLQWDFVPHAGGSVGNVLTHLGLGGAVRLGFNLPDDFGPPALIHGASSVDRLNEEGIGAYFFVTAEGRYVAHNIFLDGNTWRSSHSVDREPWVGRFSFGVAMEFGRYRIAYTNAFVTEEFQGQSRPSRFGAISASFQAFF